ncbi:peptide ABC transporter permease [Dictyobacter alpinus]|uniref:Peptide ABC transporter permease n=1 Tax=Dictyobacter alpinus TaxID=2014873 RepID=A0A402B5U3_9CHLR|nr:ABC transporter permease [Dictyobacter alpinus]GCE26723.1 peptide ABC transporter permease [Dictyobacter alpinus]
MTRFLLKRLVGLIFILLGVTFITFILGYLAPGDPIKESMGDHFNPVLWQNLRHAYGFDLPWYEQYLNYLVRLAHFDLGTSFHPQQRPVWDILKDGVPISVELSLWGSIVTLLMGVPIGIVAALKANTWLDTLNMGVALVLYSLPSFILAVFVQLLILWIDKTGVGWPVSGWGDSWQYTWGDIQYKLVPILTYGAAGYAYYARLTRTTMLEVLRQDFVRTARAKGLRERAVVFRHALRNAIIPLITAIGLLLGLLVTGSFFIENIFSIPGIANITVAAVSQRNYPVIQATTIMVAIGVVFGNLLSDILYGIVDPRIQSE